MKDNTEKDSSMHHFIDPLTEKTNELTRQGYTEQFKLEEKGLKSLGSGKIFQPGQIKIREHERFEGTSDPGDMSILYAIEAEDGTKGTVIDAFGTYSDFNLGEFMKQVKETEDKK